MVRIKKRKLISELLEIIEKVGRREDDYIVFDMEAILRLWEKSHKGPFKQHGYGKMSAFLRQEIGATESDGKYQLENERVGAFCVEKKAATTKSSESVGVSAQSTGVADKSAISRVPAFICDSVEAKPNQTRQSPSNVEKQGENQLDDNVHIPVPEVPTESTSAHTITSVQETYSGYSEEERNFIQLGTMLYRCGLEALRELFQRIHPSWRNQTSDIKKFEKGRFKPDPHEVSIFNSGNIEEWDITLICKVLLLSKDSMQKLKKDESFKGCNGAIKKIRSIKNKMLSHNNRNKIPPPEYLTSIQDLKNSVITLGFDEGRFEEALKSADFTKGNLYFQMFLDEVKKELEGHKEIGKEVLEKQSDMEKDMSDIKKDVSKILKEVEAKPVQSEVRKDPKPKPGWDEWPKVRRMVKDFDTENNQYILMVDRFKEINSDHVVSLANIAWKLVIDLDPNSDIDGFLTKFRQGETKGGNINNFIPSKIKENLANLDNMIDPRRMLWLFVNGRNRVSLHENDHQDDNKDRQKDTLREWRKMFQGPVDTLIRKCCEKLDHMKPTFVIVFGIRSGVSIQIAQELLEFINREFDLREFSVSFLSFAPELDLDDLDRAAFTNLSPKFFLAGLTNLLGVSEEKYKLPSSQKILDPSLSQMKYNFLSEYLELLYIGCEEIPENFSVEDKEAFKKVHLKKFLCGKEISFQSLFYQHDVPRNLTRKVYNRMSEMLHQITKSQIVQITHAPGSGGTTIARRVLWDLHDVHPCAIAKIDRAPETFGPDSEGEKYLDDLCERIAFLEEHCDRSPAILIDGNSRHVRIVSDCLVRKLEARAVILRCGNYEKTAERDEDELQSNQANNFQHEDERIPGGRNDTYFSEEDEFKVNPELNDGSNDYSEFQRRYRDYCEMFPRSDEVGSTRTNGRERVFHFPMMAMLDEFEKLGEIVNKSLDILKKDGTVQYEIAVMVAFLQLYSKFATPARLVKRFFQRNSKTYREVTGSFSETLVNLMVPARAPSKETFAVSSIEDCYSGDEDDYYDDYDDDDDDDDSTLGGLSSKKGPILQSYSFQHPKVAQLVLDHSGRSLDQITQDFIQNGILENYRKDDENRSLIENLFLYNKESTEAHFSILVIKLAEKENGGRIFEEAARQTKDVTFFSHVARFFAYKNKFKKARDLIKEGFETDKNAPTEKKRGVLSTEGHIVLREMKQKSKTIEDIECLRKFSDEALGLFRRARDNPPRTFPNPLLGEVMVWQFCFEWFIKRKKGDVEEAIKCILTESFFAGAIGECIYLLDEVDRIVETVPSLNDPGHTKAIANERRRLLVQAIGRGRSKTKRGGMQSTNVQRLCNEIITKYSKTASEKDLVRLRILWMLSEVNKQMHLLSIGDKKDLYSWLDKLVNQYKMFVHARELMESAAELIAPPFDIDEALKIVGRWQNYLTNDPFSYLFQYIFCFLKVRIGSIYDYRPTYETAIEACRKKSQGNPRRRFQQYFLGKHNGEDSVCNILTRSKLESLYGKRYLQKISGAQSRDVLDHTFWDKYCRDFLLECTGRIECTERSFRGKTLPYIMMEPGNIKVSVPRTAIGTAHMDYQPDSRVHFVVCFTLSGPIAKGIRFADSVLKGRKVQSTLNRQGSTYEKSKS